MNPISLIDANVSFGNWPFQYFPHGTAAQLASHLSESGIQAAYVSSLEALLYPTVGEPNRRLARAVRGQENLHPLAVIHPGQTGWREEWPDLAKAAPWHGIKLHPNFHGYRLKGKVGREFAAWHKDHPLPLVICLRVEDERNQYPRLTVKGVPVADVLAFAERMPETKILVTNAYFAEVAKLLQAPNLLLDTAMVDGGMVVERLCAEGYAARFVFGSHSPLLYTLSNVWKVTRSCAGEEIVRSMGSAAERFFHRPRPGHG